jgi:hypothetical protein
MHTNPFRTRKLLVYLAILFVIAPVYVRATTILPPGISDMLTWKQASGTFSVSFPEPANDTADEPPQSLGPFILINAFVVNRAAVGQTLDFAVLLTERQPGIPPVLSDVILWHTTGMANGQQSITVDMDSDPLTLQFANAAVLDTQGELGAGNDLTSLFFTPAGIQAGFGLVAISDIPEPNTLPVVGTVLVALSAAMRRMKRRA